MDSSDEEFLLLAFAIDEDRKYRERIRRRRRRWSSSSDSDDGSETDIQERTKKKHCPLVTSFTEISNDVAYQYSESEFKTHLRMSRHTFDYLGNLLNADLIRQAPGCKMIPSRLQLLVAIWKMATKDSYRSISDRFNVGKATAVRAVRRVTHALFIRSSIYIKWPTNNRAIDVMKGFEEASGFPKTIGAIDCIHIRINGSIKDPTEYVNDQGHHSIQLQLVCDHNTLITHCHAGQPGSVDNQTVFQVSEVANYLEEDEKFPQNSHIVGDIAYELHQHLLTPFHDDEHLTVQQDKYNVRQSAARLIAGKCVGALEERMRSLQNCLPMSRRDLMAEYIVACCVIHNICLLRGDECTVSAIPKTAQQNRVNNHIPTEARRDMGTEKRDEIMNSLK